MVDSVEYPPSFQMRNALLDGASDLIDTPAEIFFFMREGFLVLCIRAGVMWSARRFVDSGENLSLFEHVRQKVCIMLASKV